MKTIPLEVFALNVGATFEALAIERGPVTVTRYNRPAAVLIRATAYAPRLDKFEVLQSGDLQCTVCGREIMLSNPHNLGCAAETANAHWRDVHGAAAPDGRPTTVEPQETPSGPVGSAWDAGDRLRSLYPGCMPGRGEQIRQGAAVLGWRLWSTATNGYHFILKDGRHGGPLPTARNVRRKAEQMVEGGADS